ncbi:MAG: DUF2177 family protein [Erysipelotrichaceae bacterium]|nr:DUF2177 family protein [Erysipelotrichaceae bacterium]
MDFTSIRNYFLSLGVFLLIDMVWLLFISKNLYSRYLGYLMTSKVNFGAAFLFYLLFVVGLMVFVIQPALVSNNPNSALLFGLLFGLVTYATYDLTNLATVKDWPLLITVIDLAWGSFVSGSTAWISYQLIKLLFK